MRETPGQLLYVSSGTAQGQEDRYALDAAAQDGWRVLA